MSEATEKRIIVDSILSWELIISKCQNLSYQQEKERWLIYFDKKNAKTKHKNDNFLKKWENHQSSELWNLTSCNFVVSRLKNDKNFMNDQRMLQLMKRN